jgi:hypothetical protein
MRQESEKEINDFKRMHDKDIIFMIIETKFDLKVS